VKTIPTAKEFFKEKGIDNELVEELLISFAKLHLQAQRKEMEKEKSYRGMLVEVIVKSFITDYLFHSVDRLKEILQEKLDLNLKFDTNVSEIETKNEHVLGKISFEDENNVVRVIDFTIAGSSVVV